MRDAKLLKWYRCLTCLNKANLLFNYSFVFHVIPILLCFTLTYSSELFGLWRALRYTWKWVCSHAGARYCTKHKSNPSTAVRPKVEACWSKNANIAHDGFGMLCRCRLLALEASSCDVGRHVLSSLTTKARFSNMLQEKKTDCRIHAGWSHTFSLGGSLSKLGDLRAGLSIEHVSVHPSLSMCWTKRIGQPSYVAFDVSWYVMGWAFSPREKLQQDTM